jgi:deoxycytidine triphosphate deaminase
LRSGISKPYAAARPAERDRLRSAALACALVILSDRTIKEQLKAGRIEIDPLDEECIQPSSVDLHIDRYFRVFRNHTMGFIDVKQNLEDLTELIEVPEDEPFILHPASSSSARPTNG